jgi:hypothetical protein
MRQSRSPEGAAWSAAEIRAEKAPEGGLPEGGLCGKPLVSCSEAAQPKGTEADGALI